MQANNTIMLIGRVGRDPETRTISNGRSVTEFSMAVNRMKRDDPPDWFRVSLWGKQAELAGELIRKGSLVSVVGACHIDEWEKDGQRHRMVKVAADNFQLLGSKAEGGGKAEAAADDLARDRQGFNPEAPFGEDDDGIPPF